MELDFNSLSPGRRYFTMIQTIVPRPVAWVLSDNGGSNEGNEGDEPGGEESYNLAPFSYFTGVCSEPPLLLISVGKKPDGEIKDTRLNIIEREYFVVHIASEEQAAMVTASSAGLPHGESELTADMALESFADFPLPRLRDCAVAFACRRYRVDEIGDTPQAVIYGLIEAVYINDAVMHEVGGREQVNAMALNPLSRLGGDDYGLLGKTITVPRPR